jgi:hypothetical protein
MLESSRESGKSMGICRKEPSWEAKSVNRARHKAQCTICAHADCAEIETGFVNWASPANLAEQYGLADRTTVYRHAHALGLFEKRKRNVRAALERIIEKSGEVEVTASAVVAAIQAYSKINAQGQWIERSEYVNLNELFERMSKDELERCARDSKLPDWFTETVSVLLATGQEDGEGG